MELLIVGILSSHFVFYQMVGWNSRYQELAMLICYGQVRLFQYQNWKNCNENWNFIQPTNFKKGGTLMKGCIMSWLKRWWRHQMETFSALLVLCVGIHPSPVNSHLKGQRCGALMISLMYAWTNGWAYNRDAGDLRLNCAHYDIPVMIINITIGIIMIMMIRSRHKFAHVMPAQLSCTTAQLLWHVCARRNDNVKTTSFWRYFWVVCPLGAGPFDTTPSQLHGK